MSGEDLTASRCEELLQAALAEVNELENAFLRANCKVTYFRRRLRKAVVSELVAKHGRVEEEGSAEGHEEVLALAAVQHKRPCPHADDRHESREEKGAGEMLGSHAVPQVVRGQASCPEPAPSEPATSGRPKREKRPDAALECIACWCEERGKRPGVAHLYRRPCRKPPPTRGRWANKVVIS